MDNGPGVFIVMTPIDLRIILANPRGATRAAELERLHRTGSEVLDTRGLLPVLLDHFGGETVLKSRRLLAQLIVRFAEVACEAPGLAEELTASLSKARTRNETHSGLVFLRLAARKGWDLTVASPVLIEACSTPWAPLALDVLTAQAEWGTDVLSQCGTGGLEFWEVLKLLLEFQAGPYEIRLGALQVILASGRHRPDHLAYYADDVVRTVADGSMSVEFRAVAIECQRLIEVNLCKGSSGGC